MTTKTTSSKKTFALIGAGVGLSVFLAVGLLPTLLYGGYAGVLLASGLLGAPVGATFAVRALIVAGMVVAVALAFVGSLSSGKSASFSSAKPMF